MNEIDYLISTGSRAVVYIFASPSCPGGYYTGKIKEGASDSSVVLERACKIEIDTDEYGEKTIDFQPIDFECQGTCFPVLKASIGEAGKLSGWEPDELPQSLYKLSDNLIGKEIVVGIQGAPHVKDGVYKGIVKNSRKKGYAKIESPEQVKMKPNGEIYLEPVHLGRGRKSFSFDKESVTLVLDTI